MMTRRTMMEGAAGLLLSGGLVSAQGPAGGVEESL